MNVGEVAQNQEFIDEEIIKIICDAIKNVFDLNVKFESTESQVIEVNLESDKDKNIYKQLFYN